MPLGWAGALCFSAPHRERPDASPEASAFCKVPSLVTTAASVPAAVADAAAAATALQKRHPQLPKAYLFGSASTRSSYGSSLISTTDLLISGFSSTPASAPYPLPLQLGRTVSSQQSSSTCLSDVLPRELYTVTSTGTVISCLLDSGAPTRCSEASVLNDCDLGTTMLSTMSALPAFEDSGDELPLSVRDGASATHCPLHQLLEGVSGLTWLTDGGMASIYTGFWLGAATAIKFVRSGTKEAAAVSRRESLVSMRACHPNCVQTYWSRTALVSSVALALAGCEARNSPSSAASMVEEGAASGGQTPKRAGDGFDNPLCTLSRVDGAEARLEGILSDLGAKVGDYVLMIAMEWCDGGSLQGTIHSGFFRPSPKWSNRLVLRALLRTACEVAKGMLHLHSNGIVHRDLKPANVLLRGTRLDRRGFVAKVADFGLARNEDAVTPESPVWSTLDYMAPERFAGHGCMGSDVWAFGVLLHTLITGEQPYGHLPQGAVVAGVSDGLLRPTFGAPACPALVGLAQSCWHFQPSDRPTFGVIVERLQAIEDELRNKPCVAAHPLALAFSGSPTSSPTKARSSDLGPNPRTLCQPIQLEKLQLERLTGPVWSTGARARVPPAALTPCNVAH